MLTVGGSKKSGKHGSKKGESASIMTFGGDRERFELDPFTNFFRVENDVWRWSPSE
jgi:hypothetical protein